MDEPRHENRLEQARRYVREAEHRIARLTQLIADVRALGKPVDDLERLLAQYYEWLRVAQVNQMHEEKEASRGAPTDSQHMGRSTRSP